jgi:hypothetical protein
MDDPHDKPTEIARVKIAGRRARRTVFAGGERRPDSGIFQPPHGPDGGVGRSLDEAKAAFRAAGDAIGGEERT